MGTDIHAYVAYKDNNGYWKAVNAYRKNDWYDPKSDNAFYRNAFELMEIFDGRDYVMFDALANVRGSFYDAIAADRGLDGAPAEIVHEHDCWGGEDHGASWVGVDELSAALRDKKRYPKGNEYDRGPRGGIKALRNAARTIAGTDYRSMGAFDTNLRVYFWFDS